MSALTVTRSHIKRAGLIVAYRSSHDPWTGEHGAARPEQRPPDGEWTTWLAMAGRGWGKTRTGAEFIRQEVQSGRLKRGALVGPTAADVRDVMIEGESGLLACCERAGVRAVYKEWRRRVDFPDYGAVCFCYSAEEPARLRGPQHDTFWADELGAWRYSETWDQLQFGLRLGERPRGIATTTPKPVQVIRDLVQQVATGVVALTRGRTYDNAKNLAKSFINQVIRKYEGTRLGRQELEGELLKDVEGAHWSHEMIGASRVRADHNGEIRIPSQKHIAVAIDPATTYGEGSDQTGIAAAGRGVDGEFYVHHIAGLRVSPDSWATYALRLYQELEANEIVYESNQGGEMVKSVIVNAAMAMGIPVPSVRGVHASRGKEVRAEPVVLLYEQGKVHHVGTFADAEAQMCAFPVIEDQGDDMVDALVHAVVAVKQPRRRRAVVR